MGRKRKKKPGSETQPDAESKPLSADATEVPPVRRSLSARAVRFFFRPKLLVAVSLIATAFVCAPILRERLPDLNARDEYRVEWDDFELVDRPDWVPSNLVEQVMRGAEMPGQLSLLDTDLTEQVAKAFHQHPWIERVEQVRKRFPAAVEVKLRYRRPVAMVRVKQGLYPIDARAVLLPPDDFSVTDTKRFPLIVNVASLPQGPAGVAWGDVAVTGAGRLAESLVPGDVSESYWQEFHLQAIRIPDGTQAESKLEEILYELLTEEGSVIVWGRAPGTGHPAEVPVEKKVARLRKYLAQYGRFDYPRGPYLIDVHHLDSMITRKPLVEHEARRYYADRAEL